MTLGAFKMFQDVVKIRFTSYFDQNDTIFDPRISIIIGTYGEQCELNLLRSSHVGMSKHDSPWSDSTRVTTLNVAPLTVNIILWFFRKPAIGWLPLPGPHVNATPVVVVLLCRTFVCSKGIVPVLPSCRVLAAASAHLVRHTSVVSLVVRHLSSSQLQFIVCWAHSNPKAEKDEEKTQRHGSLTNDSQRFTKRSSDLV